MIRYEEPIATIYPLRNHFNAVLEANAKWSEWEKAFSGVSWERSRTYRVNTVAPALFQLIVPSQKPAAEWHGPSFVIGEAKGTVQQQVTLSQLEVRTRLQFSSRMGGLTHKSWQFAAHTQPLETPPIDVRELTQDEHETHAQHGGSGRPQLVTATEPAAAYNLGYEREWYIRQDTDLAPRFDPESQVGRVLLQDLRNVAVRMLPEV